MDSTLINLDNSDIALDTILGYSDVDHVDTAVDVEESVEELLLRAELQQAEMAPHLRITKPEPIQSVVFHTIVEAPVDLQSATTNLIPVDDDDDDVIFVGQMNSTIVNLCSPEPQRNRILTSYQDQLHHNSNASIQPILPKSPARSSENDQRPSSPKENTVICSICLDSAVGNTPHSTNCGHIYCGDCIKQAIKIAKKCPLCKKTLNMKNIFPIYI